MNFPTRDNNIVDHVYSNVRNGYKAMPRPHFGQSDNISVLLYPAYKTLLNQSTPVHLYTLFTYDCIPSQGNTSIIKFDDDTTVTGLITVGEEKAYREEVAQLVSWCRENNIYLNAEKTKEMIINPRRRRDQHAPLHINGTQVES